MSGVSNSVLIFEMYLLACGTQVFFKVSIQSVFSNESRKRLEVYVCLAALFVESLVWEKGEEGVKQTSFASKQSKAT